MNDLLFHWMIQSLKKTVLVAILPKVWRWKRWFLSLSTVARHCWLCVDNYWVAMGYPVLKWGWFFFFSNEELQFLRNIACIRLNNDAAAVWLARLEHRHNNLIEGSTRRRATWKNSCGRHSSLCFSFAELLSFRAVNSIYSRITFLVAMFAVRGCA